MICRYFKEELSSQILKLKKEGDINFQLCINNFWSNYMMEHNKQNDFLVAHIPFLIKIIVERNLCF